MSTHDVNACMIASLSDKKVLLGKHKNNCCQWWILFMKFYFLVVMHSEVYFYYAYKNKLESPEK